MMVWASYHPLVAMVGSHVRRTWIVDTHRRWLASNDLTLPLAVAHEEDSTLHLHYKFSTTVIKQGKRSCAHEGIWKIKNANQTPASDRRRWRLILMFQILFCDAYNQEQDGARGYSCTSG